MFLLLFVLLHEERIEDDKLLLLELGVVLYRIWGIHSEELFEGYMMKIIF